MLHFGLDFGYLCITVIMIMLRLGPFVITYLRKEIEIHDFKSRSRVSGKPNSPLVVKESQGPSPASEGPASAIYKDMSSTCQFINK